VAPFALTGSTCLLTLSSSKREFLSLLDRLKEKGAARCQVEVETRSADELVALATFDFFIKTG
jgi:hypothetical protein